MGRHHSDSEESHGRSKKKKKRRSRSRSDSVSSDSSRSNRSRKKSKKSHRRHSRSRSSSRSYRRNYRKSRSRSPGRYTRSRSRSYRSYSRSRSRSPRRHKHSSRTASPRRRSRSRSHRKSLSRSPRRRSRTPRRSRSRSRRCSVSPGYKTRSRSASKSRSKKGYSSSSSDIKVEPGIPVPPSKQAELKLQQALRAAAIADEKLKEAGLLPEGVGRSLQDINLREQHDAGASRAAAIEAIEDEGFTQTHFTSSKNAKASSGNVLPTHDNAIFGSLSLDLPETDPAKILKAGPCDPKSLMHPNFFVPAEKKMEKWCQKLKTMRDRKLEGEEM